MYDKLARPGCHCLCAYTHPDALGTCITTTAGDVVAHLFGEPITIPMCRPCADAYQQRYMKESHAEDQAQSRVAQR
jgi:hypothetical protein